jgi:hypothetical protein
MANQGKAYASRDQSIWAKPEHADIDSPNGIYVGTVKEIIPSTRDGSIRVWIPALGTAENNQEGWIKVAYASPYLGSTPGYDHQLQLNAYEYTKQSYGFWATPPDVENQVLCCFPPSKGTVGFWFACITTNVSKYMLPAGTPSTSWNNIDSVSLTGGMGATVMPNLIPGTPYPVGEYNENDPNTLNSDFINNPRPINGYATAQLIRVGLDGDITRGAITSSAQRDTISSVFGFSTPGRPLASQDPANNPTLSQQIASGTYTAPKVTARVPGHSFVMDDGDIQNKNNLVRLKTAAGHQVLMNDSEGFMYISNSTGTAWVELTKEGDVLIYNKRDLSIRSQGNIQMHSDHDIIMNAKNNIKMTATSVQLEGSTLLSATGGKAIELYGGSAILKAKTSASIYSGGSMSIKSTGSMMLNGSVIGLNSGGGNEPPTPATIPKYLNADSIFTGKVWAAETNMLQSACYRIPTHEPYIRGNIAAEAAQQQAATSTSTAGAGRGFVNPSTASVTSPNVEQALESSVNRPAPTSAFISQPDPTSAVGALSLDETRAYMAQTGYTESTGNYSAVNQFGYAGKYQMGSAALQDAGLLKPGTPQTADALNNPNNWIGGPGKPASLNDFLSNPALQEQTMINYTQRNYNSLTNLGVINSSTPTDQVAGYLSASHLMGTGNVQKWVNGTLSGSAADANGTTIASYFQQGRYSQTQVSTITASNSSKTILGG